MGSETLLMHSLIGTFIGLRQIFGQCRTRESSNIKPKKKQQMTSDSVMEGQTIDLVHLDSPWFRESVHMKVSEDEKIKARKIVAE